MYIISCILSITKMSKEELADYVSITVDMINDYLSEAEIPKKIRERLATIFSFPSFYFDVDVESDEYFKKIIKESIRSEWEKNKPKKYIHNITDEEIIDCLINAHDLITHEKFDNDHILNNKYVKKFLIKTLVNNNKNKNKKNIDEIFDEEEINNSEDDVYNKLLMWRRDKSLKEGLREFMIISDKVLKNIIDTPINEEKDLLKVSGIGLATFGKYGSELYEIVKDKDNEDNLEIIDV